MIGGKHIAITRSSEDSEEFIKIITREQAHPVPLPTLELVSKGEKIVEEFLESIKKDDPDFSVFMSSKAVKLLFDTARKLSLFEKLQLAIANTMVVAVGPKTKASLEKEGIRVAYTPDHRFSSVGVGEIFTRLNVDGKKVIIPRSGASTPFLSELLERIGLQVKEIYLYDVCAFRNLSEWNEFRILFSNKKIDGIIFTSASSVRAFFEIMLLDFERNNLLKFLEELKIVAIGPFTADEIKKFGLIPIISEIHTVVGAIEKIKTCFS